MTSTMYDRVGGEPFFEDLTRRFYGGVESDEVLRPLYPDDPEAFEDSRRWLRDFLVQYWGGPATYSEERGHPRLRMRHAHLAIGLEQRDAWLRHMLNALDHSELSGLDRTQMTTYFRAAADHMRNQAE